MIIPITSRRLARPRNLLDQHPGAIHATALDIPLWSVSANNPCLLLRRDDDNAVAQFTPAEVRDQQPLLDFVGSGNQGFIEATYDQSLTGRHWTQTTTASQPRLVNSDGTLNLLGGRAAGLFDGSDDFMDGVGFEGLIQTLSGGWTIISTAWYTSIQGGPPSFGNMRGVADHNVGSVGVRPNLTGVWIWRNESTDTSGGLRTATVLQGESTLFPNTFAASVIPLGGPTEWRVRVCINGGGVSSTDFTDLNFVNSTPWRTMVGTRVNGTFDLGRIAGGYAPNSLLFNRPLSDTELQDITGTLSTPVT